MPNTSRAENDTARTASIPRAPNSITHARKRATSKLIAVFDKKANQLVSAAPDERTDEWRCRPLTCEYPYVYIDGTYLKRSWGGSYENVAVMVAIGVNEDGYREVIGCAEGFTESSECWRDFLSWLKSRRLRGVRMFTGDKAAGMVGSIAEVFPKAKYQRCTVHFYRNALAKVPKSKRSQVAAMLKAVHAMESREASAAKAEAVAADLESMKLKEAAKVVRDGYAETLTYCEMPREHWRRIRTNNAIERLNREIRRRTRVVGMFPDGESALMLVAARLKYVADSEWGSRRYLDASLLKEQPCRRLAKSAKTVTAPHSLTARLDDA